MAEKCENSNGTAEKRAIPFARLALSALTGLVALAIFLGVYGYIVMRPTAETAERAGVYVLRAAECDGLAADSADTAELTLELNADGTCRIIARDEARRGHWKSEGGAMTLICGATQLRGLFSGDTLSLNGGFAGTAVLALTREGDGGDVAAPVGQFILRAIDDNGRGYSGGVIDGTECAEWYINLKRNGEGRARIFADAPESVRVDGGRIILRSMRLECALDDDVLTVNYPGGVTLFFERHDESK